MKSRSFQIRGLFSILLLLAVPFQVKAQDMLTITLQETRAMALEYTQQDVTGKVEKAYRKAGQPHELIDVAQQAVQYRTKELKLKEDRIVAGLISKKDLLETQAAGAIRRPIFTGRN